MTRGSRRWDFKLISYFSDVTVEKANSEISGALQVRWVNGRLVLDSGNANYSYGSLHRLFRRVFHSLDITSSPPSNLLLLGLGGGSVVSILRDEFKLDLPITAVEIDPEVIRLARDHFGLDRFNNLEIQCRDAEAFMQDASMLYGMIIVDLFVDNNVPEPFTSLSFLAACKSKLMKEGTLIVNFIALSANQLNQYLSLLRNLDAAGFRYTEMMLFASNKVLIIRSSGLS